MVLRKVILARRWRRSLSRNGARDEGIRLAHVDWFVLARVFPDRIDHFRPTFVLASGRLRPATSPVVQTFRAADFICAYLYVLSWPSGPRRTVYSSFRPDHDTNLEPTRREGG